MPNTEWKDAVLALRKLIAVAPEGDRAGHAAAIGEIFLHSQTPTIGLPAGSRSGGWIDRRMAESSGDLLVLAAATLLEQVSAHVRCVATSLRCPWAWPEENPTEFKHLRHFADTLRWMGNEADAARWESVLSWFGHDGQVPSEGYQTGRRSSSARGRRARASHS